VTRAELLVLASGIVAVAAGPTACGSFGADAASPSSAPDASVDATTSPDGGPGADGGCASCGDVASRLNAPTSLFAQGGRLFFTDGTRDVESCDANACAPTGLSNGPSVKATVAATGDAVIAIDATCGNAVRSDGVYLYARDGSGPQTVGDPCPTAVTAAGSFLFVTSAGLETVGSGWSVKRCSATSCETLLGDAAVVPPFGAPKVVAATNSEVYFGTASGHLIKLPNAPNAASYLELLSGEFFTDLVTDGTSLAWIDGTRVRACSIADCAGSVHTVGTDSTARHLAAGASGLYWTSSGSGGDDGKVMHVAPGALAPVPLVTGQPGPEAIALDGAFVYWTTHGCDGCAPGQGAIRRSPVP
jgi:hypothetical protein